MNYYCLIAGLPDIVEDSKNIISVAELKTELQEQLSVADSEMLRLLFAEYDNANFLTFLRNKDAQLNLLGNLNADDWSELVVQMEESEKIKDARLRPYMQKYYAALKDEKSAVEGVSQEDYLTSLFYDEAMQNKNTFLRKWFAFNLNVNNILTGVTCRKYGFDQKALVVGNNDIAQAIRQSNARDFGLAGMFDELETVLRIAEESDLLEREKKIDALKWKWLEDNTFFHYFSVEKVMAYVLKIQMVERWKFLSVDNGSRIFRELLAGLKDTVKFNH